MGDNAILIINGKQYKSYSVLSFIDLKTLIFNWGEGTEKSQYSTTFR